jgi:LuxR family maltose regulon positive regulatory protein
LAQGNLTAAEAWAAHIRFDQDNLVDAFTWETSLLLARLRVALLAYESALPLLTRLLSSAQQGQRQERVAQTLALQVVALAGLKKQEQARQSALHLLQVTQPGGLVRVFLNAGEPMRRTLQQLHATHATATTLPPNVKSHLALVLDAFEKEELQRLAPMPLLTQYAKTSLSPDIVTARPVPHEPLSTQEQRVLRLLIAGRTYAEMAQELIVSPNTIKTQVSSIYRKLGVSRRAEASLVARHFHLL